MSIQPVPAAPATVPFPGLNEKAAGTYNAAAFAWGNQMPAYAEGLKALGDNVFNNATEAKAHADIANQRAEQVNEAREEVLAAALTAVNAPGTLATSTTSLDLLPGMKAFVVQSGKAMVPGQYVTLAHSASELLYGRIQSYDTDTGAVQMLASHVVGSGIFSSWSLSLSGPRGDFSPGKLFFKTGA